MSRPVAFLKMIRLPMVFTAMADSAAGSLVGGGPENMSVLAAVLFVSAALYSVGMILNDVIDVRRDREIHPERPLVTGALSWTWTLATAVIIAGAALLVAHLAGPATLRIAIALLAAILLYNLVSKHLGILGAANMGACRGLNLILGFTIAPDPYVGMPFVFTAFAYILLVTSISLLEEAPNRPMYITLMILLAIVPLSVSIISNNPAGTWAPIAATLLIVVRLIRAQASFGRDQIRVTIGTTLRLIIVLDACYAAAVGQWIGAALILTLFAGVWASTRALKVMS